MIGAQWESGMVLLLNVHVCSTIAIGRTVSHDNIHTQLWTVGLLRLLSMDLIGHQQPQHSQGQ